VIGAITSIALGFAAASDGAEASSAGEEAPRPRLPMEWEERERRWFGTHEKSPLYPEGRVKAWLDKQTRRYKISVNRASYDRIVNLWGPRNGEASLEDHRRHIEEISWILVDIDRAWTQYAEQTEFMRMLDEHWLSIQGSSISSWTFWTKFPEPLGEVIERSRITEISIDTAYTYAKMQVTLMGAMNNRDKALRLTELLLDLEWKEER